MGNQTLFKVILAFNLFCLISYSIVVIVSAVSMEGNTRVGMLSAFGVGLGYAVLFFMFMMFSYFTPDFIFGTGHEREHFIALLSIMVLYLAAIVAVIITGSQMEGYWRIALIVGGSVAIVHYFGFILAIIGLMGLSVANGR